MKFKIGDTVTLNSGGPLMTVAGEDADSKEIICQWFLKNGELKKSSFPETALTEGVMYGYGSAAELMSELTDRVERAGGKEKFFS